jgi:peptidoglycan/LPS O-acetylase OafA/YrhL
MKNRVVGLDILRAVAILLVMWSHSLVFLKESQWYTVFSFKPFDGVDLFFVLSGFLIGGLMLRELESNPKLNWSACWTFVRRRWLRTLPAYYVTLSLLAMLGLIWPVFHSDHVNWWSFVFFYQNLFQPLIGFFWESWSLAVEEWFYVLWPLAIGIFTRWTSGQRAYLWSTSLMLLAAIIGRHLAFNPALDDFWMDVRIRKMVTLRWDSIAIGLFLVYWMRTYRVIRFKRFLFGIGITILIALSVLDLSNQTYFKQVTYFTIVSLSMAMLIPWIHDLNIKQNRLIAFLTFTSRISYSLYLVNLTLVCGFISIISELFSACNGVNAFFAFWIMSYALAYVMHRWIEKPFLVWRDKHIGAEKVTST